MDKGLSLRGEVPGSTSGRDLGAVEEPWLQRPPTCVLTQLCHCEALGGSPSLSLGFSDCEVGLTEPLSWGAGQMG